MSEVPFSFLHLDHLVLRTAEPERLLAFYCGLGCEVVRDARQRLGLIQLRLGTSMLDILDTNGTLAAAAPEVGAPDPAGPNLDHFAVRIEPFDADAIIAFCDAQGIEAEPSRQPLLGADGYGPAVYIKDPDGNRVELKGPPQEQLSGV